MLSTEQAHGLWTNSEEIINEDTVRGSLDRMAEEITGKIDGMFPMMLSAMGGAAIFTGILLSKLAFPLGSDYIHLSRCNDTTVGGEIQWRVAPRESVKGRTVLMLDDILDENETMATIRSCIINIDAAEFCSAMLYEKAPVKSKPLYPDFCNFSVPNRYVLSCGMDTRGYWRNLPTIHVLKNT